MSLVDVPAGGSTHTQDHRDLWDAVESGGGGGGNVTPAVITLTPSNLTDSVTLPAGAYLLDFVVAPVTLPDGGGATLDIGDVDEPTGYLNQWDLSGPTVTMADAGPYVLNGLLFEAFINAAYFDSSPPAYTKRFFPAGGTITATVTDFGITVMDVRLLFVYAVPA